MWRRLSGIVSFFLGCLDWVGRVLVAEDIVKGRLAVIIEHVISVGPSWMLGFLLMLSGLALIGWDIWDRKRGTGKLADGQSVKPPDQPSSVIAKQEVEATERQERVFVAASITPEYLLAFFREHTATQARKLAEAYVGKWMKVSGSLGDVNSYDESLATVAFASRDVAFGEQTWFDYTGLFMYFHDRWVDRVAILKRGDKLTVIGQIKEVERIALLLDNCELVDSDH